MVIKITKTKIIEQFVNCYDKKFYLRELASLLRKPHQTIKPHLEKLVQEGILIKIHRKNILEYGLNFKNKGLYDYLIIAEKEILIFKLSKEVLLKILFERLSSFFINNTFLVFGSSVEKLQKNSDVDLLIIGKSNVKNIIDDFEKIYNKKIHKVQVSNLNKLNNTFIKEIYKKHIIFNNSEQIVRCFGGLYEKNNLV